MEKNLKEEQTVPFLDQIMVLQKAHRTQRDADSAVIEQLEHLSQELQSANTELSSSLAHITADNESLKVLDKDQKKLVSDREMMCASLQDNLLLSEAVLKKRNSTIIDMGQQIKFLHATAEESVAQHINDRDKSREIETLQASVLYLQNQLEQVIRKSFVLCVLVC